MDELLTPGRYEARIDELALPIVPEAALDALQPWGQTGQPQDLQTAIDILKNDYLGPRRTHLFETHSVCTDDIPDPQPPLPRILITEIMYRPAGRPRRRVSRAVQPLAVEAVDLSGWRLDGAGLTIPAGTVVLPQSYVLFVKNDTQFRSSYGGGNFVAAEYKGSLNDFGESLVLRNRFGGVVSSVTYDDVLPWPTTAGNLSLELVDLDQGSEKVANWQASQIAGGSPGAPNSVADSLLAASGPVRQRGVAGQPDGQPGQCGGVRSVDRDVQRLGPRRSCWTALSVERHGLAVDVAVSVRERTVRWLLAADLGRRRECDRRSGAAPHQLHPQSPRRVRRALLRGRDADRLLELRAVARGLLLRTLPRRYGEQRVFPTATPELANLAPSSPLILNEYNAVAPGQAAGQRKHGRILGPRHRQRRRLVRAGRDPGPSRRAGLAAGDDERHRRPRRVVPDADVHAG